MCRSDGRDSNDSRSAKPRTTTRPDRLHEGTIEGKRTQIVDEETRQVGLLGIVFTEIPSGPYEIQKLLGMDGAGPEKEGDNCDSVHIPPPPTVGDYWSFTYVLSGKGRERTLINKVVGTKQRPLSER